MPLRKLFFGLVDLVRWILWLTSAYWLGGAVWWVIMLNAPGPGGGEWTDPRLEAYDEYVQTCEDQGKKYGSPACPIWPGF